MSLKRNIKHASKFVTNMKSNITTVHIENPYVKKPLLNKPFKKIKIKDKNK